MSAVDEYRSWCREHVRESPGFDLADAAIAELEGHIHSSADWLRAQTAEAELAERERMLRLAWQTAAYVRGLNFPEWLADLRARV